MLTTLQQWVRQPARAVPYPLALQSLLSLVLLATIPSAMAEFHWAASARLVLLCIVVVLHLVTCWLVPARRLPVWLQVIYLSLQVAAASLANLIIPSQALGYVYLVIVLQAVYLFRPVLWVIFAAGVYIIWSGWLMIASSSLLEWVRGNLLLAFPVTCILIATIVYARQHRRHEQVQLVLQQMQQHYEELLVRLRDAEERSTLEERRRLAQTIVSDITATLAQTEQSIARAISQAQSANLGRLEATVAQTRVAATAAIERMRASVASLRLNVRGEDQDIEPERPTFELPPDELMTIRTQRTLIWTLPLAFVAVALPLALLQSSITPALAALFVLFSGLLIAGHVLTQHIRSPLLIIAGLFGQAGAVLGMVLVSNALPLALGLLLVMWQTAMRLSGGQIVAFLIGVQTVIGLALVRILPLPDVDTTQLLTFCVACLAVTGLMGTARRQLSRRRYAEVHLARLAHLSRELEQQLAQVHMLAVAVERTRLAREIHDDLGHRLMLLNVQLQVVEDVIDDDPSAALTQLRSTREQLREAWSSMLGSADAVLAIDGTTLAPAIEQLVAHCRTLTPMRIELRMIGDLTAVDPELASTLYRAVQEGLTNACKYANAEHAYVLLYCDDAEARVMVRDDGCSSEATAAPLVPALSGHFGLESLRERAEHLGGTLEAGPLAEQGFMICMTVPIP